MRAPLSLLVGMLLVGGGVAAAAPPAALVGDWEGALHVGHSQLRLVLHVSRGADGRLAATVDSPDQGASGLAVTRIEPEKQAWVFTLAHPAAAFAGTLSPTGDALIGEWRQGASKLPLAMHRASATAAATGPEQLWDGRIEISAGLTLRFVLHLRHNGDGSWAATADSPDQGARGMPVDRVSFDGKTLAFTMAALGATYSGTVDAAGTVATGKFTQHGAAMPLVLHQTDKLEEARRPQNPQPPFPYRVEEVAYENASAGVQLAGTLTLPPGKGPFPSVLLITGSGAQDRDETLLGHKPFWVLADALTRRGIAVLRVDDRGVGGSTGSVPSSTSQDFAGDALAGVAFLKKRPELDGKRIGLIGHSEGGIVAPIAATRSPDVAFIVLLEGPALPGAEILRLQGRRILEAMGADAKQVAMQQTMQARLIAIARSEKDPAVARQKAAAAMAEVRTHLTDEQREALDAAGSSDAAIAPLLTPWFQFFLDYDPRPTLAKVRCPVLALLGEKDLQVPAKENAPELRAALAKAGNPRSKLVVLPGLNHLLQPATTGAPSEYATIEETMAPIALTTVGDWILGLGK